MNITETLQIEICQNNGGLYLQWLNSSDAFEQHLFDVENNEILNAESGELYKQNTIEFKDTIKVIDFSFAKKIIVNAECDIADKGAFEDLFTSNNVSLYTQLESIDVNANTQYSFMPCLVKLTAWECMSLKHIVKFSFEISLKEYE